MMFPLRFKFSLEIYEYFSFFFFSVKLSRIQDCLRTPSPLKLTLRFLLSIPTTSKFLFDNHTSTLTLFIFYSIFFFGELII